VVELAVSKAPEVASTNWFEDGNKITLIQFLPQMFGHPLSTVSNRIRVWSIDTDAPEIQ
jgi:hypothetical protein